VSREKSFSHLLFAVMISQRIEKNGASFGSITEHEVRATIVPVG